MQFAAGRFGGLQAAIVRLQALPGIGGPTQQRLEAAVSDDPLDGQNGAQRVQEGGIIGHAERQRATAEGLAEGLCGRARGRTQSEGFDSKPYRPKVCGLPGGWLLGVDSERIGTPSEGVARK